jgi:hypothetical protein
LKASKSDVQSLSSSTKFEFGGSNNAGKIVIYRLIPLQERGQLRSITKYALNNEPHFYGVTRRWILNRIWNNTDYEGIYGDLMSAGVKRRDIISNCFDIKKYQSYETKEEKLFYLTAQNEGGNIGIVDGRNSGFEWSVILDGNTFITKDSWETIEKALFIGSKEGKSYMMNICIYIHIYIYICIYIHSVNCGESSNGQFFSCSKLAFCMGFETREFNR